MSGLDYGALGLRVGLEIHQQLLTKRKLFCRCPAELSETREASILRRLRPTRSELGEVDPAALFEWRRGRIYEYEISNSCLVESDEEPPHEMDRDALVTAIAIAMALGSTVVDEIHVMRKIVVDGSNTSGFQRTSLVALGGEIEVDGERIGIETICLEEDAARKIGEEGKKVIYRLDRLGVPLIEIATAPVIRDPEMAKRVALYIGRLLRLTRRVRRGIGTIRQDLNISIAGGAKVEIKGVQRPELIPKVIEYEVRRQLGLLKIREEMIKRGFSSESVGEAKNVTQLFANSQSRLIRRALEAGGVVITLPIRGLKGLLGEELTPGRRFGTELADYAKFYGGVAGILHSDELPGYGISGEDVLKVYEHLSLDSDRDAFILVADAEEPARKAIEAVRERLLAALRGVPEETRAAQEDGTTRFMRPRPGSARMYPETDVPPIPVTLEMLSLAESIKPEPLSAKLERLVSWGLSRDLAMEVLRDERLDLIEELIERYRHKLSPTVIASIFVVVMRGLRKRVDVDSIPEERLEELIDMIANGKVGKEAAEAILEELAKKPEESPQVVAERLGLTAISEEEAERLVREIIRESAAEIKAKGERAAGTIMGKVMAKLRGRIDGKKVSEIVKREVQRALGEMMSTPDKER